MANYANDSTDRLCELANEGGKGVQNPKNFANVINGCPLMTSAMVGNGGCPRKKTKKSKLAKGLILWSAKTSRCHVFGKFC